MEFEKKNEFVDICILSLLRKEGSYGYYIFKNINEYTRVTEAALYCVLMRLEKENMISSYSMEYNSRLRRYYSLTESGTEYINGFLEKWKDIADVYNFITLDRSEKKRRWL